MKKPSVIKRHKVAIVLTVGLWASALVALHVWKAATVWGYNLPDVLAIAVFGLCVPVVLMVLVAGLIDAL